MGGTLLYPHSVLHLPSFSTSSRPKFGKPVFALKETAYKPFLSSSIRADGNRERHQKNPKSEGPENNPQSFDGKTSLSPNKKEILAVFKRIQASISKGETINSTKRSPKAAEDKQLAESMLEVLHQSRARGKGKTTSGRIKGDVVRIKDTSKKEEREEQSSTTSSTSTRPPSKFTRRSPIRTFSTPKDKLQLKNDNLPETPTLSVSRDEVEPKYETIAATDDNDNDDDEQSYKFGEMKLSELKDFAKSKGIKGYSKLKKSELVELLIRSLS